MRLSVGTDFTTLLTATLLTTAGGLVVVFCFCSLNFRAISNALPFGCDALAELLLL